ncbi:MAG: LamG domain-containing protein [Myxococcales bacterium]|nr:LamG domain-containing protein [Myxococcales bacterium]
MSSVYGTRGSSFTSSLPLAAALVLGGLLPPAACTSTSEGSDEGGPGDAQAGAGGGTSSGGRAGGATGASSGGASSGGTTGGSAGTGSGGNAGSAPVSAGAWPTGWSKRRSAKPTLDALANAWEGGLPLLVSVAVEGSEGIQAPADAGKLRVLDKNGQPVPYELDSVRNGKALVWIRFPTPDTAVWIYTAPTAAAPAAPDPADVWGDEDSVWHLEASGLESGPRAHDGLADPEGPGVAFAEGFIGNGFVGDSSKKANLGLARGEAADGRLLSGVKGFTISAWVKATDLALLGDKPFDRAILSVGTDATDSNYNHASGVLAIGLAKSNDAGGKVVVGARPRGDMETVTSEGAVPQNQWTHVAGVVDMKSKQGRLFINGEAASAWLSMGDLELDAFPADHKAKSTHIGASAGGQYGYFDGVLDEIRLSRVMRSDAYLKAVFANMRDPQATISVGPVESNNGEGP